MAQTYPLFCMGNPLLDMQVNGDEALLQKYKLKANDAILAGEDQASMYALSFYVYLYVCSRVVDRYDDLTQNYKLTYVAGGAAQNAARAAAVCILEQ